MVIATRVLPKVLPCLFMFEAVHRRSNSLKTFDLQFRLGSFQTHGRRGTGWKLRQYRCSGLFERWLECDSIRFPGSSEFTFAKGSCACSRQYGSTMTQAVSPVKSGNATQNRCSFDLSDAGPHTSLLNQTHNNDYGNRRIKSEAIRLSLCELFGIEFWSIFGTTCLAIQRCETQPDNVARRKR